MARVKGILENFQGKLDNSLSIRIRPNGASTYPAHIRQPRRLSHQQLLIRERQSHNNALWRALKATPAYGILFPEGVTPQKHPNGSPSNCLFRVFT